VLLADLAGLARRFALPVATGASVVAVVIGAGPLRAFGRHPHPLSPAMPAVAAELHRLVPTWGRFAVIPSPDAEARTGVPVPAYWLGWKSGRSALNVLTPESSTAPGAMYQADELVHQTDDVAARRFTLFGTTHVVTVDAAGDTRLRDASPWFVPVASIPPFTVFAVNPAPTPLSTSGTGPLAAGIPLDASVKASGIGTLAADVYAPIDVTASPPVAWSPKWHATVDGHPAVVTRSPDHLLTVSLPAGPHTVSFRYRHDVWDSAGMLVTLVSIAGVAAYGFARRS
jgi:hypothetical protein